MTNQAKTTNHQTRSQDRLTDGAEAAVTSATAEMRRILAATATAVRSGGNELRLTMQAPDAGCVDTDQVAAVAAFADALRRRVHSHHYQARWGQTRCPASGGAERGDLIAAIYANLMMSFSSTPGTWSIRHMPGMMLEFFLGHIISDLRDLVDAAGGCWELALDASQIVGDVPTHRAGTGRSSPPAPRRRPSRSRPRRSRGGRSAHRRPGSSA